MENKTPILLYSVTWCPHCVAIKRFLNAQGIAYRDFDVDADDPAWKDMLKLTGGVDLVPVLVIGGQVRFGGFNRAFEDWITAKVSG
jgi:glutaredoxin